MKLTDKQENKIFAINCVYGRNSEIEYQKCIKQAEELLNKQTEFTEVEREIKRFLRARR